MNVLRWGLIFCLLVQLSCSALAESVSLTGTWESKHSFAGVEEVTTAEITQVEENLIGAFSAKPSGVTGIIFGTVVGDRVKANYLAVRDVGGKIEVRITFVEGRVVDQNTIKGTFYFRDSSMQKLSDAYEAKRI